MTIRPSHLLLPLLLASAILVVGQLYVTLPLQAELARHWGITEARASWAGSAFGFAYAAGFLLLGRLPDRYGCHRAVLFGLAATALATLLVALAPGWAAFLGARVLQGLAASLFPPAALAWVAQALPPERRPTGIAWMSLAFLAAAPLAQFLAAQSAGLGTAGIMLRLAPAYLLAAAGLALCMKAAGPARAQTPAQGTAPPAAAWRPAAFLGLWLAASTVLFAFVAFHAGAHAMGLRDAQLQALRLAGLPPLALSLLAAPLLRRIGAAAVARLGLALAAAGLWAGAFAGALNAASVALSGGIALAIPGLIASITERAAPGIRARAMSIYSFALFVGASAAPPLAQQLAAHGWLALLAVPALALLAAAALVPRQP